MYIGLLVSQVRQVQEVHYHPDEELSVDVSAAAPVRVLAKNQTPVRVKARLPDSRLLSIKRRSDACKSRFNHREETHSLRRSAYGARFDGFSTQHPPTH